MDTIELVDSAKDAHMVLSSTLKFKDVSALKATNYYKEIFVNLNADRDKSELVLNANVKLDSNWSMEDVMYALLTVSMTILQKVANASTDIHGLKESVWLFAQIISTSMRLPLYVLIDVLDMDKFGLMESVNVAKILKEP